MVEDGTQARILKIFGSGADAVKTHEEILETLADKDLDHTSLETSLDSLVSSGKLAQKELGGRSVYWLVSEFTCTAAETPRAAPPTPHRLSGDVRRGVRRPFVSPVMSSAKKMRLEEDQVVRRQSTPSSSNKELLVERRHLMEKIKEKEVKLQQLKNADEMEKSGELDKLIKKWREASQQAAEQLLIKAQGEPPPTMGEMLHHLHIDPKLIQYNEEDECFY